MAYAIFPNDLIPDSSFITGLIDDLIISFIILIYIIGVYRRVYAQQGILGGQNPNDTNPNAEIQPNIQEE